MLFAASDVAQFRAARSTSETANVASRVVSAARENKNNSTQTALRRAHDHIFFGFLAHVWLSWDLRADLQMYDVVRRESRISCRQCRSLTPSSTTLRVTRFPKKLPKQEMRLLFQPPYETWFGGKLYTANFFALSAALSVIVTRSYF